MRLLDAIQSELLVGGWRIILFSLRKRTLTGKRRSAWRRVTLQVGFPPEGGRREEGGQGGRGRGVDRLPRSLTTLVPCVHPRISEQADGTRSRPLGTGG